MTRNPSVFNKKIIAALWLCLVVLAAVLAPVSAFAETNGKRTIRVGWVESTFNMTDRFGRRSGYAYEYQQKIAAYTGWEYQYVTASWTQLLEMLKQGEIDLLADVSYTEERAKDMLYSSLPMGEEEYYAYVASRNRELSADDYTTFNGKKIGVNKGSMQKRKFMEWARQYGIEADIVELTSVQQDALQKLIHGALDVYISANPVKANDEITPLCKIGGSPIYFVVNNRRPDLKKELDAALNRIQDENRYYNQQLFEKYVKRGRTSPFLTFGERQWLHRKGMIRVGYRADYLPFCAEDAKTKQLTGALKEYLDIASKRVKNAKIYFEPVAFSTVDDAMTALRREEVDCVFPVNLTDYEGERIGLMLTDPPMHSEMMAVVQTERTKGFSLQGIVNVAVVRGNHYHENFLKQHFPKWGVTYFSDREECLKAVSEGRADCHLISMYRLNQISDLCNKYDLTPQSTGEDINLSFALRRNEVMLYSILNKTVGIVSPEDVYAALTSYSHVERKVSLAEFARENLVALIAVASLIAAVILFLLLRSAKAEKKAMERKQLIAVAERDNLTGLYSSNFFHEYASRLLQEHPEQKMDAVALNIEQFHSLNELKGRAFGDRVLRLLGEAIRQFLAGSDGIASRAEADTFYFLCPSQEDYPALLQQFQKKLDELPRNSNIRLRMGVMPWQEGMKADDAFERAQAACNMVRGGKKHLMVYDEEIRSRAIYHQRLLNDLRRAVDEREFRVYYQPKYDIRCDPPRLFSAEALVRWQHPELGLIPPDDFIPLFEKNGEIGKVDIYVWKEAARQIAEWKARYGIVLPVSVNLSRTDIFEMDLEETLDGILRENGLDSSSLKLEVTETAYTENAGELIRIMERLRARGYQIEMDDFGSGYSSLNMLSSMPVDALKMDRAFIRNIEGNEQDFHLVKLILDIARNLKLLVIAEGVETESQLALLKNAGCDLVQGYYFSQPVPPEEFEMMIAREL